MERTIFKIPDYMSLCKKPEYQFMFVLNEMSEEFEKATKLAKQVEREIAEAFQDFTDFFSLFVDLLFQEFQMYQLKSTYLLKIMTLEYFFFQICDKSVWNMTMSLKKLLNEYFSLNPPSSQALNYLVLNKSVEEKYLLKEFFQANVHELRFQDALTFLKRVGGTFYTTERKNLRKRVIRKFESFLQFCLSHSSPLLVAETKGILIHLEIAEEQPIFQILRTKFMSN